MKRACERRWVGSEAARDGKLGGRGRGGGWTKACLAPVPMMSREPSRKHLFVHSKPVLTVFSVPERDLSMLFCTSVLPWRVSMLIAEFRSEFIVPD